MMMFKKLSLMGLLATAVLGGHVTSAYGMNSEQDPSQIRAKKKADRRACKAAWKNIGQQFAAIALNIPEVREAVEPSQMNRWQEKLEHSAVHAEERDFNNKNYHLQVIDRELAKNAANDPEQALISAAAVDPTLENRLTVRNSNVQTAINEWKKSNGEVYEGLGAVLALYLMAMDFIENFKSTK